VDGKSVIEPIDTKIAAKSVNDILTSEAFGLVSPYSPETQVKIKRHDELARKGKGRKPQEEKEYQLLLDFMEEARPYGGPPDPDSLEARMEAYLQKTLK
jgi:hypothetical protein